MAQYDSYRSKNIRNTQVRGGSEKARFSQSETLLYQQHLSRPDIPMPRVWKSATGQNWTHWPPPHPATGSTKQDIIIIIIIIEEVMVIIGNDRRTTFTTQATGGCEVYICRQHDNISMELVEECVKRRLRRCYRNCHASIGHRRSWRSNETCQ